MKDETIIRTLLGIAIMVAPILMLVGQFKYGVVLAVVAAGASIANEIRITYR